MDPREKDKEINAIETLRRYIRDSYTNEDLNTIFSWFESRGFNLYRRIAWRNNWDNFKTEEDIKDDEDLSRYIL